LLETAVIFTAVCFGSSVNNPELFAVGKALLQITPCVRELGSAFCLPEYEIDHIQGNAEELKQWLYARIRVNGRYSDKARCLTIRGSNTGRRKRGFSSTNHPDRLMAQAATCSVGNGIVSLGVRRLGRGVDHVVPS
jgi:hypothetical protein